MPYLSIIKKRMRKYIVLIALALSHLMALAQIPLLRTSGKISNLHVKDLAQDDQGLMWIATAKGLCRYDGLNYDVFCHLEHQPQSIASDNVNSLYFDGRALWCATGNGVSMFDLDKWQFVNYHMGRHSGKYCLGFFISGKKLYTYGYGGIYEVKKGAGQLEQCMRLEGQVVQSALVDGRGRIWTVCDGNEVLCFDSSMNLCRKIDFDATKEVYCLYRMPGGNILLGTKGGVMMLDKDSYTFSPDVPAALAHVQIKYIKDYAPGKVIIGTRDNQLRFFDFAEGRFISIPNMEDIPDTGIMDLTCSFLDRNRNLWLGTFNSGVKLLLQKKKIFDSDKALTESLKERFVTRIKDDHHGKLWIGTRYSGLFKYDMRTRKATEYSSRTSPMFKQFGNFIQSLFIDSSNRLWTCNENSLLVFDISGGTPRLMKSFTDVGNIVTIAEDARKRIWTGSSFKGITIYNANLEKELSFLPATGKLNNITRIVPDSPTAMLFSAFGDNIYYIDVNTLRTRVLDPKFSDRFRNVVNLRKMSGRRIVIGTYGDGLMVYTHGDRSLKVFGYSDGLRSNDILGIEEDRKGFLWVSSSLGLYRADLANNKIRPYFTGDGTAGDQYHEKSECRTDGGEILFGGNHGITQILCKNIHSMARNIPVLLTDLKVLKRSVPISADGADSILSRHISRTKDITLKYNQNVFSLDFIGLTYDTPKNIEYAYMLEGFDREWNYTGEYNRASYSNLPSGTYRFKVKIKNGADEWEKEHALLTITVLPSPWMQPLAILSYIILFVSALYLTNRVYIRLRLRKERAIMESNEIRREKRLAQMKVNFFTNISHELRTPLTMIYDPVKILLKDKSIESAQSRSLLGLIEKNSERLLKLIDQILDYGKLKNDTLELRVSANDCVIQILDIVNVYKLYAAEKNISVSLECSYEHLVVYYDADKVDKILNNLLFNSVKYTPMGGHVRVRINVESQADAGDGGSAARNYLMIVVEDDGSGVEDSLLPGIFDRFRRMVQGTANTEIKGSGVGLNYVKHLVDNHKGTITATNRIPKGMVFTVMLPVDEAAYTEEERTFRDAGEILAFGDGLEDKCRRDTAEPWEDKENCEEKQPKDVTADSEEAAVADYPIDERRRILIVEDNSEMIVLLKRILDGEYETDAAVDGVDALEQIRSNVPDLVISDVMMPRMDGFALCGAIKADALLCHIPVIMLTARTLDKDKIKGYREGADMYISKPFNPELLLSMIRNIFRRSSYRQHIIARTSGIRSAVERAELEKINQEMSPMDKRFMDRLNSYIGEHISDSELNVNMLGRELGFSRTNFYRKVKSLTGMTPNDFLRVFRLNRAVELIKLREYPLNEIGEMVGFGTQSYFSSCFKKHFGVSPKDYLSDYKYAGPG